MPGVATTGQKKTAGTRKTTRKAPGRKRPAQAEKKEALEIWRCHVDWVRYLGTTYYRGNTINVQPELLDARQRTTLGKYFTRTQTEAVAMTSEPVEALAEGDDNADN